MNTQNMIQLQYVYFRLRKAYFVYESRENSGFKFRVSRISVTVSVSVIVSCARDVSKVSGVIMPRPLSQGQGLTLLAIAVACRPRSIGR